MSESGFSGALNDRTSVSGKRKPLPARPNVHQPASSSTHITLALQHQQLQKLSFSERYPEPDPTDPFAPLWVLRNRTSSALHREGPPILGHFLQPRDTDDFGIRQPDRRRSISYFQTLSASSVAEGACSSHASDRGHDVVSTRLQRTHSIDTHFRNKGKDNLSFLSKPRQQSTKPTPLSQVTALATPSVSRGSVGPAMAITTILPSDPPKSLTAGSSGTDSDTTPVGLLDVNVTPRAAAQSTHQTPHDQQPSCSRTRTGSTDKLTRFLNARKMSQHGFSSHNARTSITDINRIRKASISPPISATAVWASHGGELAPIKDGPWQQNGISIVTAVPDTPEVISSPRPPLESCDEVAKQGLDPLEVVPCLPLSPIPDSVPAKVLYQPTTIAPSPLAFHSSTSPTQAHTEESNSTSSFVHVPTAMSSPSLARLATSQAQANIASSATVKIRRTTSRPMSKLSLPLGHSASPSSLTSPFANTLSSVLKQPDIGEWDIPTLHSLTKAASLPVIAESGVRITFGTLFAQQKIVVLFIRHFWCPLCQDYMTSVASLTRQLGSEAILSPGYAEDNTGQDEKFVGIESESGKSGPVKLVVISNGSYTMIGKYKQIFGQGAIPLDVYTDPSLAVYTALGMGKDPASLPEYPHLRSHGRSKTHSLGVQDLPAVCKSHGISCSGGGIGSEKEKVRTKSGGYVRHGLMGGIAMVFVRALKVGMPVWEKGGDLNQLGGEFVLGPGLGCTYAHRMRTTKDHAPFEDVLRAAGVTVPAPLTRALPSTKQDKRLEKYDQVKKHKPLRKSRPSIGNPINQVTPPTRAHARGQTVDVVSAPIAEVHLSFTVPVTASTLQLPYDTERGKSKKRNSTKMSTVGVISDLGMVGSVVQSKTSQPKPNDNQAVSVGHMFSAPLHPPEQAIYNYTFPQRNSDSHSPSLAAPDLKITETQPTEDRHRSLQKIKEKRNAGRGLSQFDERHVNTGSMSLVKPTFMSISDSRTRSHSRRRSHSHSSSSSPSNLLPSKSLLPSRSIEPIIHSRSSTALSSQIQYHRVYMERTRSRTRNGSMSGTSIRMEDERAVHSDSGMTMMQSERRRRRRSVRRSVRRGDFCEVRYHDDDNDDDTVLFGRETGVKKVNLSRDYLVRREVQV